MSERKVLSMKPLEVVGYLKSNQKVMLIDVRDSDFGEGGYIKNAVNIQSFLFNIAVVNDILKQAQDDGVSFIVFYCQFGQQRSVKCANTVNQVLSKMSPTPLIQIAYIEGGFNLFRSTFHDTEYVLTK